MQQAATFEHFKLSTERFVSVPYLYLVYITIVCIAEEMASGGRQSDDVTEFIRNHCKPAFNPACIETHKPCKIFTTFKHFYQAVRRQ